MENLKMDDRWFRRMEQQSYDQLENAIRITNYQILTRSVNGKSDRLQIITAGGSGSLEGIWRQVEVLRRRLIFDQMNSRMMVESNFRKIGHAISQILHLDRQFRQPDDLTSRSKRILV